MKKLLLLLLCVSLMFSCEEKEKQDKTSTIRSNEKKYYTKESTNIDSTEITSDGDIITPDEFDPTGYINTNCPDIYDYMPY